MVDKNENTNKEVISKKDLDLILQVNKKAVEIKSYVAEQNEEIILLLNDNKEKQIEFEEKISKLSKIDSLEIKIDALNKQAHEISRDLFKIQVLFVSGVLGFAFQVFQFFTSKR